MRDKLTPAASRVITRLQQSGHEAYVVGGAVRDLLLGLAPKDYDVATSATPEEVRNVFHRQARIIGRRFRLVHVYHEGEVIEVSTFRREPTLEERKGRESDEGLMVWRDNVFGTLEEDARRRDFTVNAVYYDPLKGDDGELIDYVGGLDDMRDKVVRTIGPAAVRMQEDPVRMLRACKLMAQYDFKLEDALDASIRQDAELLTRSSQARLLEELYKILRKPYSAKTLAACQQVGLLNALLPGVAPEWGTPTGELSQRCMECRDRQLAAEKVHPSRVTGLAAMLLPFAIEAFGEGDPTGLWQNFFGVNKAVRELVRHGLEPYQLPRHVLAMVCEVILLQPKLLSGRQRKRVISHPEYARGRELFMVAAEALGLPPEAMAHWPEPADSNPRESGNSDDEEEAADEQPRRRRRRRRRRPRREET